MSTTSEAHRASSAQVGRVDGRPPIFSIVTPVFNPPEDALRECIQSVLDQTFSGWEWCIADDGSTAPHVSRLLDQAARDPRVRVTRLAGNGGIVAASNAAASMATGEFVVLLDHDDLLSPDALATVAEHLSDDVDYLYSDEDKVDGTGRHFDVFRKPSWSPERFLGQNYTCHLSVIRRSVFDSVGRFRPGFDGSQDYDLFLRVVEQARSIVHIPQVLYHWRIVPGSAAGTLEAKPYAFDAAERALSEHLERVGVAGRVERGRQPGVYRVRRDRRNEPLVSIVIPTNGSTRVVWGVATALVTNAVRSVVERSSYRRFELVVVYDTSTPATVLEDLARIAGDALVLVEYSGPFNFADKTNQGVLRSHGDVVLMLNDDTQVISPDWIEVLLEQLEQDDVGMVGPMLRLADGRIQSAGHHNLGVGPRNLACGGRADDGGPFGMFMIAGERTGVTAACAALRREVYDQVGGLSNSFPRSFNDVDLGFKLLLAGYRIIWTPFAELYHFESLTRNPTVDSAEVNALYARWSWMLKSDAYVREADAWWSWDEPRPAS